MSEKRYSIELDEINKASERFRGLSDAADSSADRATKTHPADVHAISQTTVFVNEGKA